MKINNPLAIPRSTFFLCGPDFKPERVRNREFEEVEKRLTEKEYLAFNPQGFSFRERVAYLTQCKFLLTLNGWEQSEDCKKEVQIARILGIEVILVEGLDRWEQSHIVKSQTQ